MIQEKTKQIISTRLTVRLGIITVAVIGIALAALLAVQISSRPSKLQNQSLNLNGQELMEVLKNDPAAVMRPISEYPSVIITYKNSKFNPRTIEVKVGQTLIFKNESKTKIHPKGDPAFNDFMDFDSYLDIERGKAFSYSFLKPGTYHYYDSRHPSHKGVIIVTE